MLTAIPTSNVHTVEFVDTPQFVSNRPMQQLCVEPKYFMSTTAFIGLELSLVPEVEQVFVDRGEDREFCVTTVVNRRDPELRKRIYRREQALIDELKGLDFDFQIIERVDRDLNDIVTGVGKLVFKRQ